MRCADFGPTPGRQRSASIKRLRDGGYSIGCSDLPANARSRSLQNGSLKPGGQVHAAHDAGHLLLRDSFDALRGVVDGGRHQVFEHLAVVERHRGIDLHALGLVLAIHRDLDHAATRLASDLHGRNLRLRLLHVGLHHLRLLHHVANAAFHASRLLEEKNNNCWRCRNYRKSLRIVNLANGGFKQPQQFFVAAYFMDKLDLVINLDGLNDAHTQSSAARLSARLSELVSTTLRTDQSRRCLCQSWPHGSMDIQDDYEPFPSTRIFHAFRRSSLYFVCWSYLHDLLYLVVKASEAAYYTNEFVAHQSETLRNTSPTQFMEKRIGICKKYASLENTLVGKVAGKPIFFSCNRTNISTIQSHTRNRKDKSPSTQVSLRITTR